MSSHNRIFNWILLGLLVAMSIIIVTFVWLYVFDQNPAAVIFNSPMPTDKTQYHYGDTIYFPIKYCRYTNVPTTIYMSFEDSLIFDMPPRVIQGAPRGCGTVMGGIVVVPVSLPPGHYRLTGRNEYDVNPIAVRYTDWYTTEFDILP